jgi:hypothetical protein
MISLVVRIPRAGADILLSCIETTCNGEHFAMVVPSFNIDYLEEFAT